MNPQAVTNTEAVKGEHVRTFTDARIRLEEVLDLALKVRAGARSIEFKIDCVGEMQDEKEPTELSKHMSMPERAFDLAVRIESILSNTGSTLERIYAKIG